MMEAVYVSAAITLVHSTQLLGHIDTKSAAAEPH
jgi:hypothetical protein